jgi:hypothetical protein
VPAASLLATFTGGREACGDVAAVQQLVDGIVVGVAIWNRRRSTIAANVNGCNYNANTSCTGSAHVQVLGLTTLENRRLDKWAVHHSY